MKGTLAESARDDTDLELLPEFLAESVDNLGSAGTALVNLEKRPHDSGSVDAAFRTFHSIKGTCGFFDLNGIQVVSHRMETLLSEVKKGARHPDTHVTSTLLRGVDVLTTLFGSAVNGAGQGEAEVPVASPQKTMRIDEATIDAFPAYTGELIGSSETFAYLQGKLDRERLSPSVKEEVRSAVRAFQALSLALQKGIMEVRKLPLETSFAKYPRLVRDLSRTLGKQVSLEVVGSSLRIDHGRGQLRAERRHDHRDRDPPDGDDVDRAGSEFSAWRCGRRAATCRIARS